uniref:Troponin T n=1 Tax=Syphacia muris TaxID=451379 RepID=A0A0N5AHR0_9BILA
MLYEMSEEEGEEEEVVEDEAAEDEAAEDEEVADEDEEEETIEQEAEEAKQDKKPRSRSRASEVVDKEEDLTEGEKAMLAAKKRQEEEAQAKLAEYEEMRRIQREKEEEEMRALKEKQERRRQEREEEEREFAEKRRQEEEKHRQEEEERKARVQAEKKKKEEEKKKRMQLANAAFAGGEGRNFVIPKKKSGADAASKFGNIVQAKQEMGMTKEQQEEAKRNYLEQVRKILDFSGLGENELREKIKEIHQRICRLEADKYDLEKRNERQEYDLRELNERQRQVARSKAAKKGLDPGETNSRYPPKISIVSKYDRQIDRRNFKERRAVYENKHAFPCFPNVPPPPAVYAKVIKSYDNEINKEDDDEDADEDAEGEDEAELED